MKEMNIDNIMNLIHKAEDTFLKNGLTVSPSVYKEIQNVVNENKQYKQQIDELEKWLVEEIARLDIELGNTFGVHGIIIKEKYDLRDAYIQVLSKLKERE